MASTAEQAKAGVPPAAQAAVLVPTETIPDAPVIKGYDFNAGRDLDGLMAAMLTSGFQATTLGQAVEEVNRMIDWRLSDEPVGPSTDPEHADPEFRAATRTKIYLGYTSNLISAGVREQIRFLVQHSMVDVVVTTAGGIEEDFIKCLGHTYMGDFQLKGSELRMKGLNRIGNMLVPNSNYCKFEDWIMPILDQMLVEQNEKGVNWTPSKLIARLGLEIDHPDSVYYWAARNGIPVYCPAITDGSIGDMLFFHSYKNPGLRVDVVEDIRAINDGAMRAAPRKTGMIILGGGVPKHHINNANLMRNGADFAVVISTAQEYDGSDSGARPDEAVSWGKIRMDARPVKVCGDATVLFPLVVSQTFAKKWHEGRRRGGGGDGGGGGGSGGGANGAAAGREAAAGGEAGGERQQQQQRQPAAQR
ncbi:deoxyhypusine synthase [Raphidocelis subcapitata]|uniref:Deoxyhypusine synthase n=1 Tax=Raphidocelis subcapitata TaxID=307507 RepID=A0A2V0P2T9_9CHLO|nr:deoxyhypusine synthase [Raphidocelis subcapitata]|eukprot:GBF92160.1 deoxyhypusine synthase [Raphidocelis subcapitata]